MYSFYIDGVPLPMAPQKLSIKIKGKNKTLVLVNDGEINFLKSPGLTEISFEATFPMTGPFSFSDNFNPPEYYMEKLERLMTRRKPFRFIVSRALPSGTLFFDTNMNVSLEDYSLVESAKDGLDVTASISLKQYKSFATKTVTLPPVVKKSTPVTVKTERAAAPKAKTYTVKRGDCMWAIAQSQMNNGSAYPALYEANKAEIDRRNKGTGNPKYTIYAGQVFTIP